MSRRIHFQLLRPLVLSLPCCTVLLFASTARAGSTGIMGLQSMQGGGGLVKGVSADGTVVTGYTMASGRRVPFRWTESGGAMTLGWVNSFNNPNTEGRGVSDNGIYVVGTESFTSSGSPSELNSYGFRWSAGSGMQVLSDSGIGLRREAKAVANTGRAVGWAPSSTNIESSEAAIWNGNQVTLLGLMLPEMSSAWTEANAVTPDGSVITGSGSGFSNGSYGTRAFRWTEATGMIPLGLAAGQTDNYGTDISTDGSVIVGNALRSGGRSIFRWTLDTGVVDLGRLPGTHFCDEIRTSGDGTILVGNCDSVPFIWTESLGLQPLLTTLESYYSVDLTGWYLGPVADISADGRFLVGTGAYNGVLDGWRVQIPEPGVGTLLLAGLLLATSRGRGSHGVWKCAVVAAQEVGRSHHRIPTTMLFLVLATLAAATSPAAAGNAPSFMGLGDLPTGDFFSSASDVSDDGRYVVGQARRTHPVTGGNADTAVRWDTTTGEIAILSEDRFGNALSISSDGGTVVGTTNNNPTRAFRWTAATGAVRIGGSTTAGEARGVSADGSVVVGTRITSTLVGGDVVETSDAFRWTSSGGLVGLGTLGGVNSFGNDVSGNGSIVVGTSQTVSGERRAFRWAGGSMTSLGVLPGFTVSSSGSGVSTNGDFVVGSSVGPVVSGAPTSQAFLWSQAGGMIGLGDLPGGRFSSAARDVSADGSVVVGTATRNGLTAEAMIWDNVNGMRHLKDVLEIEYGLDLSGWTLYQANAISDDGKTIVGYGTHTGFGGEAWIAHIPEPASGLLVLTAISAIGLSKRGKRGGR